MSLPAERMVEIVDRAVAGRLPVRPNKPLNIVSGIFVGGVLGILLATLVYLLQRRAFRRNATVGNPPILRRLRTIAHVAIVLLVGVIIGYNCAMPMSAGSLIFMQLFVFLGGIGLVFVELANPKPAFLTDDTAHGEPHLPGHSASHSDSSVKKSSTLNG